MAVTSRRWLSLAVLTLGTLVAGLDMTVMNVALPTIGTDLCASTTELQWFADSYLLVLAVMLLPAGLLGDRLGRKPTTLLALAVFLVGSLWCAWAGAPAMLTAGRAVLGLGGALLTPMTFSWLVVLFDDAERPRALGVLGTATFLGMPLGPIVAGWLLESYHWSSIFFINVPLIGVALLAGALLLPGAGRLRPHPTERRPVDWPGIVLSVAGLSGFTYGVIEAPAQGWTSAEVLVTALGGLAALVGLGRWEVRQRRAEPLVDTRLLRLPDFVWGASAAAIASMVAIVALFTVPLYLQAVLGFDAFDQGLRLLPMVGGLTVGVVVGVVVAERAGPKAALAFGLSLLAVGALLSLRVQSASGYGTTATWIAVFGAGFGAVLVSGQNLALGALDPERAGSGGALAQVLRQTGSVLGIAVFVSLLNSVYRGTVDVGGLRGPAAAAVRDSFQAGLAVAQQAGSPELAASVREAFIAGMHAQAWLSVAASAGAAVLVLVAMPGRAKGNSAAAPSAAAVASGG